MGRKDRVPVLGAGTGGDSLAVRDLPARGPGEAGGDDGGHGSGSGLRLDAFQYGARPDDIAFTLLLSFTRHLIRNVCGSDVLFLAMTAARHETNTSDEQVRTLYSAVRKEQATHGFWPKGF